MDGDADEDYFFYYLGLVYGSGLLSGSDSGIALELLIASVN